MQSLTNTYTQLVTLPNLRIIDYVLGPPGSVHNSMAFKESCAYKESNQLFPNGKCVRAHLRLGMYHVLVLMELRWICGTGTQGDGSLLNALSRKCYMHMLQYVHRGTLP